PIIFYENGYIIYLDYYSDIPIGVVEDYTFKEDTYLLPENTQIILYTDGITDSENRKNEFFGEKKIYRKY
ncbi:MAG: serine/threonine-protein phosphatase, partial [Odoribacter sp.]|nr:serine/threonine-protein phosphatase [Odoribacter sp.]